MNDREMGPGPSKKGYWLGGGILALGVLGAALWFGLGFMSFTSTIDDFRRLPANGQAEFTFDKAGGYVVYFEGPGADDGNVPAGNLNVTNNTSEAAPTLEDYESELSYDVGGHTGLAVFTVGIPEPGPYLFEATSDGDGQFAIGPSVGNKLVTTIVGAFAIGGLGVLVGAILLIVTAVRRRRGRPAPNAPWIPPPPGTPVAGPPPASY